MMLSSNYRQFIRHRFPILTSLIKKYITFRNDMFYKYVCKKYHSDKELVCYKGCGRGKRCFVIGNGSSLKAEDLSRLVKEDCFACNHIERIFSDTDWRPKFYTVVDPYFTTDINLKMFKEVFLGSYFLRKHKEYIGKANCINGKRIEKKGVPVFIEDVAHHINAYPTVVFANFQLAVYMGYSKIYLLGVDHDWVYTLDTKKTVSIDDSNRHFYANEKIDSKLENNPFDVKTADAAYKVTKEYCDAHNIQIYNATRGGKLEIFERVDFDNLF